MIYIYGLIDPLVHQIAYVGKTNDLYGRWESHVKTEAQHIAGQWIQRLRAAGIEPTLVVLETMADDADWANAERWWIAHGLRIGWPLTNTMYAGEKAENHGNAFAESIASWNNGIEPQLLNKPTKVTPKTPRYEFVSISSAKPEITDKVRCTFLEYYDRDADELLYGGLAAVVRSIYGNDAQTGGSYRAQALRVCSLLRDELSAEGRQQA